MIDPETRARAPEKPRPGQACNGCGYCCAAEPCGIARDYLPYDVTGPCPAMEFEDGRFRCGMVRRPSQYMLLPNDWADALLGPLFAELLGLGLGCDADATSDQAERQGGARDA